MNASLPENFVNSLSRERDLLFLGVFILVLPLGCEVQAHSPDVGLVAPATAVVLFFRVLTLGRYVHFVTALANIFSYNYK